MNTICCNCRLSPSIDECCEIPMCRDCFDYHKGWHHYGLKGFVESGAYYRKLGEKIWKELDDITPS